MTTNKIPHTYPFACPRAKLRNKGNHEHNILRYMAYMKVSPTHSLHKWDLWHQLTCFLGLLKSRTVLKTKSSSQFHILVTWSFWRFFSRQSIVHFILLKWHSQITQWCINPYQGIVMFCLLLFSPISKRVYVGLQVGINNIAYLYCICCEVKSRIQGEKCHTLRSRCACVWKKRETKTILLLQI